MNFSHRSPPQNRWVLPGIIRVTEEYHYQAEISHISDLRPSAGQPVPTGKVEIIVPYNEWRNLTNREQPSEALINVSQYKRTDLDARLTGRGLENDQFPLQAILQDASRICSDQIEQLHDSRSITLQYEPQKLLSDPLALEIKVYDQIEVADTQAILEERKRYSQKDEGDASYDLASRLSEKWDIGRQK